MNWIRERLSWIRGYITEPDDVEWEEEEVEVERPVTAIFKGSNIATYNLQIFTPDLKVAPDEDMPERDPVHRETEMDKRVLADLPAMLEMVEEALQGLLPSGYQVRITEWNK